MTDATDIDRIALDHLLESVGGDAEFMGELLATYFEDSPRQIAAMRAAVAAGNAEDLRRAAHTLKSNSANFGAVSLSGECKELEAMAKAGTLAGADERIAYIETEYEAARVALEAIRGPG